MLTSLTDHLWQSTVFAAAVWGLALLARRHRAELRHRLWLIASVKFLIPFSALVALGRLFPLGTARVPLPDVMTLSDVAERFAFEPLDSRVFVVARRLAAAPAPDTSGEPWLNLLLAGVWAAGVLVVVGRWTRQWLQVRRIVRSAAPISEGREIEALRRVESASRSTRRIPIVTGTATLEPGVVGIVRPVLFWPQGLSERLSDVQLEAILAHELAHVLRRDNPKALTHMVVQALFWFHPVVWWIGTRLVDEREKACDEQVVRQGREREAYAQGILATCAFAIEAPLACVSGVTGADLKRRIESIMRGQPGRALTRLQRFGLICAALAVVTTPVVAGSRSAPRPFLKRITILKTPAGRAAFVPMAFTQDSAEKPSFEVASVRENVSVGGPTRINMQPGGRFTVVNFPLRGLVRWAYQLQSDQIVDLPGALADRRFDIVAKTAGDWMPTRPGTVGPIQQMMQSLLAERFDARVHRETRELPVLALVRARRDGQLGPNLKVSTTDCEEFARALRSGGPMPPRRQEDRPTCGMEMTPGKLRAGAFPISELVRALSDRTQRIVIDQTGLTGAFDMDLNFTPEPSAPGLGNAAPPAADPDSPTLTTALQEQLGLKLESTRAPIEVLVIEHVAMPTSD